MKTLLMFCYVIDRLFVFILLYDIRVEFILDFVIT